MPRVTLRNLRRRVFAMIAVTSLILCLATVALWVRSHWKRDIAMRSRPAALWSFESWGGIFTVERTGDAEVSKLNRSGLFAFDEPVDFALTPHGFYYQGLVGAITFPHWFLAFLFAIVPAWSGMAIARSRRRVKSGCCVSCGYDLRVQLALSEQSESSGHASPNRCPECGATLHPALGGC